VGNDQPDERRRRETVEEVGSVSAVAIVWIVVAAACCGLCVYGISRAVRRSRERQAEERRVLTQ
jgi:hypothetical protein